MTLLQSETTILRAACLQRRLQACEPGSRREAWLLGVRRRVLARGER